MPAETSRIRESIETVDPVWSAVRTEAEAIVATERALGGFIYATVLSHDRLEDAVCHRLAQRLNHSDVDAGLIGQTFADVLAGQPEIGQIFRADLAAVYERDPACHRYIEPLLYFKGFHALVDERNMVAHTYFLNDDKGTGVEFLAVNAREKLDFPLTLWTVEDVQSRVKKLKTKRRHFELAAEAMNPITMAEILKGGDKINAVLKALVEQGYPIK